MILLIFIKYQRLHSFRIEQKLKILKIDEIIILSSTMHPIVRSQIKNKQKLPRCLRFKRIWFHIFNQIRHNWKEFLALTNYFIRSEWKKNWRWLKIFLIMANLFCSMIILMSNIENASYIRVASERIIWCNACDEQHSCLWTITYRL